MNQLIGGIWRCLLLGKFVFRQGVRKKAGSKNLLPDRDFFLAVDGHGARRSLSLLTTVRDHSDIDARSGPELYLPHSGRNSR
jgi:hypothetical protein